MYIELNKGILKQGDFRNYEGISIWFKGYVIWEGELFFDKEFDQVILNHYQNNKLFLNASLYNGIYKLVIIDRDEIVVIRDRWGIEPLYYRSTEKHLSISDSWQELIPGSNRQIDSQAVLELLTLGYSLGNKTMLNDILEFEPHTIYRINYSEKGFRIEASSYWELSLPFREGKERKTEKDFATLWKQQIDIYTQYIFKADKAVYMPFSGGLDCRLIAHELNLRNIDLYALTYGDDDSPEVSSAREALSYLNNLKDHFILHLNKENTEEIFRASEFNDRITCSFPSELLHFYQKVSKVPGFTITGFSGDFMAGSHLKYKMRFWKSKEDIVDYIIRFKSTTYLKQLYANNKEFNEGIHHALVSTIPDSENLMSSFIRWDVEQRQRRYIARSAFLKISELSPRVLLPFFDYQLMDFFLEQPLDRLWNANLYTNAQVKYLYKDNPGLIKAARVGKRQKVIHNNFIYEYGPKLIQILSKYLGYEAKKDRNMYANLDYNYLIEQFDLPESLKSLNSSWKGYPINTLYMHSISEAHKMTKI